MKTIFNITAAIILAVTLSACKDDVKDISSDSDIASAVQGEVVHTAVIASGIKGEVSKLGDGIYAFSLAIKGERKIPTGITLPVIQLTMKWQLTPICTVKIIGPLSHRQVCPSLILKQGPLRSLNVMKKLVSFSQLLMAIPILSSS